jgi:TetR/AcrR family transcriptional regulator
MEAIFMFSKFLTLNEDKQHRILNAAIKEFSLKGFDKASTNEIVKEANISKGLLFHYFKNKKELYLFLYDFCIKTLVGEFWEKIHWEETDIINRYQQVVLLKLDLLQKYPDMFQFLQNAYFEESSEIKVELDKKNKDVITASYAKLYQNIDFSLFKEGLDIKKTINLITWSLEGFSNQQQTKIRNIPLNQVKWGEIIAEMDVYLQIIRKSFYK